MFGRGGLVPELVPQLSRGKHRSPRKGACFMEMASYLAGERWSDRPACTHPLLGALARLVNDHISDAARSDLAELIPSVIGLTSDDPHVDVRIMLRTATTALPVASAGRQRSLAVSVLAGEQALDALDGRPAGQLEERSREALTRVPHAAQWARRFTSEVGPATPKGIQAHGAPATVRLAVVGIAEACIPNPDAMLHDLLTSAIADCAAPTTRQPPQARPLQAPLLP
jgi:hypothetical protein